MNRDLVCPAPSTSASTRAPAGPQEAGRTGPAPHAVGPSTQQDPAASLPGRPRRPWVSAACGQSGTVVGPRGLELEEVPVPPARGDAWAYVSPSRLNCWLSCPLKFRLMYLDGLRPPTTPALFLGKACHRLLEAVYRQRQLGQAFPASYHSDRFSESWGEMVDQEGMRFDRAADEEAMQRQVLDLVDAYLRHVPAHEPRPLGVETPLQSPLVDPCTGEDLGIPLVGIVDLILDGPDGALIADFKTSSRSAEPAEALHEIQLSCYSYLFRQSQPRPEAGLEIRSLIKTRIPKIEFHRYPARTEGHFRRLFCVIRAYLDDLDAGRFLFRPGFHCSLCDFGPQCRAWDRV